MRKEAMHYKTREDELVLCNLCPHGCTLKPGSKGICGVREAKDGAIETLNYGEISSLGMDPIEKKPLYHFKPGAYILSAGSYGCNFSCGFCQNYSIAKNIPNTKKVMPNELMKLAEQYKAKGNIGIAFTYNEPSIWYEYVYDSAKIIKANGMDVVLVSNGYINREPLEELIQYVDAMNIDLKAFNDKYYKNICNGNMKDVMATIEYASSKCHVEITTLLVNGYNDTNDEVEELSQWLASIDPDMPLHLSRYHPSYKFDAPPTPVERIMDCASIARKHLHYVYIGNVSSADTNTYCYKCGKILIERNLYSVNVLLNDDRCPHCGAKINIVL